MFVDLEVLVEEELVEVFGVCFGCCECFVELCCFFCVVFGDIVMFEVGLSYLWVMFCNGLIWEFD